MEEMSKQEQIAFLENAIATLTEMRNIVTELMVENAIRLGEINANIARLSTANADNTANATVTE
jgi:hypothetical protein